MQHSLEFITDRQIYERIFSEMIPAAKEFVWIATADIKDLYVNDGRRMVPFLKMLADLCDKGIALRLIHAKEPGPLFREEFDRSPALIGGLERMLCPRVHFKCVIVDGRSAYSGSANLTGAGMGAKSVRRRNFESGIFTGDSALVAAIMAQFDEVWIGKFCDACDRKKYCGDYRDMEDQAG